ncbi:hypothetical protein MMC17_001505 [Xylographa soralifera]|nr:hypothetical protein [Xylographa soralifera]
MAKRSPHHQRKSSCKARATASDSVIKTARLPTPKSLRRWKSTTTHHGRGFWDLLTRSGISINLTKRALQEFDRRTVEEAPRGPIERALNPEYFSSDIKRFSRHADYSDLRGYPEPTSFGMVSGQRQTGSTSNNQRRNSDVAATTQSGVSKSTSKTTKSARSSAYDSNFMSLLISNHIDRPQFDIEPANYDQLRNRLAERRDSLSSSKFTKIDYRNFVGAVYNAREEGQVMTDVFSVIKGPKVYPSTTNRPCNNWVPLTPARLVIPQPDFFYGECQKPRDAELRKTLDGLIVPSTSSDAPFLPNFLAEAKPPGGSAEIARRQAVYDGAFGARAMHHLQAYGAEEAYDGNAYTFTSTYTDGKLEIFAHHMTAPDEPGKQPFHHTVSLDKWLLDKNIDECRCAVAAFRNARDMAREFRESFIADANDRMKSLSPEVREQKTAQASARMWEILDRNTPVEPASATAQSPSANTAELQTSLEGDGSIANGANIVSARQAKKPAARKQGLLKKVLTSATIETTKGFIGKRKRDTKLTNG